MKNIFEEEVSDQVIDRIEKLTPSSQPLWGKMNVGQMLAHCNVTYDLVYDDKRPKPSGLKKLFLKYIVKNFVVGEKPYKKNSPTASEFLITDERDFESEKNRLTEHVKKTQKHGKLFFDQREYHSFGKLNISEWNNMFYKHLDHHLNQFGV